MLICGAKAKFERQQAFYVMADIEFICHAHAAVQLDGLLRDESCGLPDQRLGARHDPAPLQCIGVQAVAETVAAMARCNDGNRYCWSLFVRRPV